MSQGENVSATDLEILLPFFVLISVYDVEFATVTVCFPHSNLKYCLVT